MATIAEAIVATVPPDVPHAAGSAATADGVPIMVADIVPDIVANIVAAIVPDMVLDIVADMVTGIVAIIVADIVLDMVGAAVCALESEGAARVAAKLKVNKQLTSGNKRWRNMESRNPSRD